ncbi:hypothetical protein G7046_g2037 [Stylonectria norvegica]|nr:hypothetical protein G7046_g2037 [Stylonectria norvegica]
MSTTMVMTMATPTHTTESTITCCPGCGFDLPSLEHSQADLLEAQARIADLDQQVRLLNQKATAAVDRWADYEDELTSLRAQLSRQPEPQERPLPQIPQIPHPAVNNRTSFLQTGTSRLSALLSPRKSTPNLRIEGSVRPPHTRAVTSIPPPSPTAEDLLEALTREQGLRKEAEGQLNATSKEVEELSAALFEQANEMVADERRARAKLEERVGELEKRDVDKRRRLERLEGAMARIERVRNLLAESESSEDGEAEKSDDGDETKML